MDDPGAIRQGDIVIHRDKEGLLTRFGDGLIGIGQKWFIGFADQVAARHFFEDLEILAKELGHEHPGHIVADRLLGAIEIGRDLDQGIFLVRVDTEADIGRQGPGRRRPGCKIGICFILDRETDENRGVLDVVVTLGDLMRGQGRATARAIRHDFMALVKQALLPDPLQSPPLGLDIIVVVGDIGVVHVGPEADPVRHRLPFLLILPDRMLALVDEGLDAIGLDLRLAINAEGFFDLQLNRQAMRIPAGLAQDMVALHGLVARDDVLDDPGQDMADMRLAVGRRRTIEKGEFRPRLAQFDRTLENVIVLPELQDLLFAFDKTHVGRYFLVHGSSSK